MNKAQEISEMILKELTATGSIKQSFDRVIGEGAYDKLAHEIYTELRAKSNQEAHDAQGPQARTLERAGERNRQDQLTNGGKNEASNQHSNHRSTQISGMVCDAQH